MTTSVVAERPRLLINTCFICDAVFVARDKVPPEKEISRFHILCQVMQIPIPTEDNRFVPESKYFCFQCDRVVNEFLKLREQIQGLFLILDKLRNLLGKRIVDTYSSTNRQRKNYHIKSKFFEVWRGKIESCLSNSSSSTNVQQSFASVLGSLEICSEEILLQDQNNSEAKNYVPDNSEPSQETEDANDYPPVHQDEDDRLSIECPSPCSPVENHSNNSNSGDIPVTALQDETVETAKSELEAVVKAAKEATKGIIENASDTQCCSPVLATPATSCKNLQSTSSQALSSSLNDDSEDVKSSTQTSTATSMGKEGQRPVVKTRRRTHSCKFCGKLFPSNFAVEMHERIHTGEKPFKCGKCDRRFNNKSAMQIHELIHDGTKRYEGEPQYECDLCGKKYHLRRSLQCHKQDHARVVARWKPKKPRDPNAPPKTRTKRDPNAPKPEKKPKVKKEKPEGEKRKRKPKSSSGTLDEHGNPIPKRKRIKRSPKPDSDKPKRTRKVYGPRGGSKEPKICTYCGKQFTSQSRLLSHIVTHTGEKNFKCEVCGRAFAWKANLDKHMVSHDRGKYNEEPQYTCDICGEGFYRTETLYHHRRRVHLGFREFYKKLKMRNLHRSCECQICGQKFDTKYKLNYHKARHTEKKHKCKICEKPFFDAGAALAHAKQHNPKFWYNFFFRHQCPACPPETLGFPSKPAIWKHWRQAHRGIPLPEKFARPVVKKVVLPPGPGQHVCLKCPEVDGKRPRYRHLRSMHRHNKVYHSGNRIGKSWKPMRKRDGSSKSKRSSPSDDEMTEDGDEEDTEESDFDEEGSADESEEEGSAAKEKYEPTRRSVRNSRARVADYSKLLDDSDDEEDLWEPSSSSKMISTGKASVKVDKKGPRKTNSLISLPKVEQAVKRENDSSVLSDEYIRKVCGGRSIQIILSRVDLKANASSNENQLGKNPLISNKKLKSLKPMPLSRKIAYIANYSTKKEDVEESEHDDSVPILEEICEEVSENHIDLEEPVVKEEISEGESDASDA